MKKIIIPNTDLKVSKLGFGTASLHHLKNFKERQKLLNLALDLGFTHFDTAPLYGEGLAEASLGKFIGSQRDKITIATKIGIPANPILRKFPLLMYGQKIVSRLTRHFLGTPSSPHRHYLAKKEVEKSLKHSLKALQTDWLDILFIHEPNITDLERLSNLVSWLEQLKKEGSVRYLGLAGQADDCLNITKKIPNIFDILQVEDSIESQEANLLLSADLPLQITFGYLRKSLASNQLIDTNETLRKSMDRNQNGMILVSSRNPERLKFISSLA